MLRGSTARVPPRGAAGPPPPVASLLDVLPAAPRGGTRRHLEEGRERGELLRAASANSSVAAVSAPSQQLKQATAVSRDD